MILFAGLVLAAGLTASPAPPLASAVGMPGMAAPAESCPAGAAPAPAPGMAGWSARTPLAAAASPFGLPTATLAVGRGAEVALPPAAGVSFAAAPGKPPPTNGRAGLLSLTIASAGTYAVGLSTGEWIDVVDGRDAPVASTAHGHGPPCSGVRKVVDFVLAPGRYVVQLSGSAASVGVLVFPR